MVDLFDLTGRVAVLVGGGGGIGHAQVLGLADAGADVGAASVHVHGRDPQTGKPTTAPAVYREIATLIKSESNVCLSRTDS